MVLKFKTKYIINSLGFLWKNPELDHKFKTQIGGLLAINSQDDIEHNVDIPLSVLLQVYENVSQRPEGIYTNINNEMKDYLKAQLLPLSNIDDVINNNAVPNEASVFLLEMKAIDDMNKSILQNDYAKYKTLMLENL